MAVHRKYHWVSRGILAGYRASNSGVVRVTLEVVDIDFLLILTLAVLVELDVVIETIIGVSVGLVDLGVLGKFTVGLQTAGLIGGILHDNITLLILVITEREQNDITLVDPDLLAELATNVGQTLLAIEAKSLKATVTQHLHNLSILLALLLEDELTLLIVVLVLTTATVLTALSLVLGHGGGARLALDSSLAVCRYFSFFS